MVQTSIQIIAACVLVFIAACLVHWRLAVARLKTDAKAEYADRQAHKPRTVTGVDEATFAALYVRSFQPRWAPYAAIAAVAALLLTPVAMVAVPALYDMIWRAGGSPDWAGRGGYVFMFSLFFGMVAVWAAAAAVVARIAHQRAPEPWSYALAAARGEPIPEETGYRRRPKWARRARPDPKDRPEEA